MKYWEANRLRRKRGFRQLAVGLPLAVMIMVALFVNFFSGWYKRADMTIRIDSSGVLVVLAGLLLTVVFVVVYSGRHRWEMNEQRYKELVAKKNKNEK